MKHILVLLVPLFVVGSHAQEIQEIMDNALVNKVMNFLPEGFQMPANIGNISDIAGNATAYADRLKTLIKEKCEKEAARDNAFEDAVDAGMKFKDCVSPHLNFSNIRQEMDEAQPKGDLDTVFNKYCARRHDVVNCTRDFANGISHCLNDKEKEHRDIFVNMFVKALDFVCHKEGDQIALFIAEKGPECFRDKNQALQNCVKVVYGGYVPKNFALDMIVLPQFNFDQTKCEEMNTLSDCMVRVLEGCEESTPANLVDSMFRFVRNETPCHKFARKRTRSVHHNDGDRNKRSYNSATGKGSKSTISYFLSSVSVILAFSYLYL